MLAPSSFCTGGTMPNTTTIPAPAHLEPSKLGTKDYWDAFYATELSNHAADPSDEGTVWFDDSDAQVRMIEFLDGLSFAPEGEKGEAEEEEAAGTKVRLDKTKTSFLDLGCGNGALLFALRDARWCGAPFVGVDYSELSVRLARRIGEARRRGVRGKNREERGKEEPNPYLKRTEAETGTGMPQTSPLDITFLQWDILFGNLDLHLLLPDGKASANTPLFFDAVLDKGTFDAVSLSPEIDPTTGRRVSEGYRARVLCLLRPGGLFLLTSCNWTEDELRQWFVVKNSDAVDGALEQVGRIAYSSFSFGGVKGQRISTLCFRKVGGNGEVDTADAAE